MIKLEHITKTFDTASVFSDFSTSIPKHQTTYLNGRSGSGKTTLLRILAGLETYDTGSISGLTAMKCSMVFQENRLVESLSIFTNIALPHLPTLPVDFQTTVSTAMHHIGLTLPLDTKVDTLSGGMKRRVALLRALLSDFDLLILDEPFTGLDYETKCQTIALVQTLTHGKTVIIVTHSPEDSLLLGITNTLTL